MVEFSVYSLGNAAFLNEILNGIAAVVGTDDFKRCVAVCMLLSVLTVCVQSVLNRAASIEWQNILLGFLIYLVFFSIPTRMVVEDVYSGEVYTVDNIPIGVSASGFVISRIGYGITDLFETGFGIPNRLTQRPYLSSLKYLMHVEGDMSSAAVMEKLDSLSDIKVQPAITEFTKNCILPSLSTDKKTANDVQVMNINNYLRYGSREPNSAIEIISQSSGARRVEQCPQAYETITTQVVPHLTSDELTNVFAHFGTVPTVQINPGEAYTTGDALEEIGLSAGEAQSYMMTSMLMPILAKAASQHFTRLDAMADTMVTQALAQRNVQWASEQTMWQQVAQPIMSFFEGFIYGITPIMACLFCLGALGLRLVIKYFQTLIWINLWMPVMDLCNLYIMMTVSSQVGALSVGVDTFYGMSATNQILQNQLGVGGMLAAATPMLALFIVTGSNYAFTTLANRLNGSDHVNEKMVRPDIVQQGALLANAPMYERNATGLTEASGTGTYFATVEFSRGTAEKVASANQRVQTESENFTYAIGSNSQLVNQIAHSKGVTKSWANNIESDTSLGTQAERREASNAINSGAVSISENGVISINTNLLKSFREVAKGKGGTNTDTASGGTGAGVQIDQSATSSETVSDEQLVSFFQTHQAQLKVGLSKAITENSASIKSTMGSNSQTESVLHAASKLNSAQKAYTQASEMSTEDTGKISLQTDKIGYAYQNGLAGGNKAKATEIMNFARNGGLGQQVASQIRNLSGLYRQKYGLALEAAWGAATAQVLCGPGATKEMQSVGNQFIAEVGFGRTSVNGMDAYSNSNLSGPGKVSSNGVKDDVSTLLQGNPSGRMLTPEDKQSVDRHFDNESQKTRLDYNSSMKPHFDVDNQGKTAELMKRKSEESYFGFGRFIDKINPVNWFK